MEKVVIIGCGNPVRGDDGFGPRFIRYLWEKGLPPSVKLVDGGTSGIDVVFHMEGADRVIIVDTCYTGEAEPGTVYKVPPEVVEELPENEEAHLHSIKWFHAIALGKHLLNGSYPRKIEVFLVEGKNFDIGESLSPELEKVMCKLSETILSELSGEVGGVYEVILKEDGYLIIPGDVAEKFFSRSMSVLVVPRGMEFLIYPLPTDRQGGLLLKRINTDGDRAVLVWELLPPGIPVGRKKAIWEEAEGALVVALI